MAVTKYEIANNALLKLGANTLSTFEEATLQSTITAQIYERVVKAMLSNWDWSFAIKKQQLTKLDETPINEWTYSYAVPEEVMKLRAIWTSNDVNIFSTTAYELFELRRLYSNYSALWADYTYRMDESYWPDYFVDYAVSYLAGELAMPITRDSTLKQIYDAEAMEKFRNAAAMDSRQNPQEPFFVDYLTSARFGYGGVNEGNFY